MFFPRENRRRSRTSLTGWLAALEGRLLLSSVSWETVWQPADQPASRTDRGQTSYLRTSEFEAYTLNAGLLGSVLDDAPSETFAAARQNAIEISLADPNGQLQRFTIYESSIMAPELAAQFPEIKTYAGQGIDDPTATVRFDMTPAGFHAQVLSAQGRWYIDPYYHLSTSLYASYFASSADQMPEFHEHQDELPAELAAAYRLADHDHDHDGDLDHDHDDGSDVGHDHDHDGDADHVAAEHATSGDVTASTLSRSGTQLRTYRTAVAASGEYTAFHGGTVALGQAAIVTAINRVSGIYENELSIRLQLVANNSSLVYTNSATDPYSNSNPSLLLSQNQSNIDTVIGSANYDIGHVFTTGGGGLAGLGVVGINGQKAMGETGLGAPIGDVFYVDYVAHEMGHQFGGNHTFNGDSGSCSGGNRNGSTAYEPGSGSTIQAYAGICGNDDLQANSDAYFHSLSFDEMIRHVDVVIPGVGTRTATGNNVPTVDAGINYTIPTGTPFTLTAVGNDADGTGSLTYNWEQRDLGPQADVNAADNGTSPIIRSYAPTSDPTRTVPQLTNLLNNTFAIGERLPTVPRTMDFRVTVRDNRAGGAAVNTDDMVVNVVDTGASFSVLSPNTAISWPDNSSQTVTWNVAGTTANGINTANVRILLSTDGGLTFGTVLAASEPNDGSATITLPDLAVPTTTARIKVEAIGNIFFDISNTNFEITSDVSTNNPPVIADQTLTPSIPENSPFGTVVGTVLASDPDVGQVLTYSIIAGNTGNAFAIDPSTGELTVLTSAAVDFETTPTFNLTIQVTDDGAPNFSSTGVVTVNVTNAADAPTVTGPVEFSFEEFSPRWTLIGQMQATDSDGDGLSYSIIGGNPDNTLTIGDGSNPADAGKIWVNKQDLTGLRHRGMFNLQVRITDNSASALFTDATVRVYISPVTLVNTIVMPPTADGEVYDSLGNGFGVGDLVDPSSGTIYVEGGATPSRGIMEFDLRTYSAKRYLKNAWLFFNTSELLGSGPTVTVPIDVYGYTGNGAVSANDATRGTLVGTRTISNVGGSNQLKVHAVPLDPAFVRSMVGNSTLGLVLRNDTTADGVVIDSSDSGEADVRQPYLLLQFSDEAPDLIVRDAVSGIEYQTLQSNGSSFTTVAGVPFFALPSGATWKFVTGDLTGDGKTDIAGRRSDTGDWWVAASNTTGGHSAPRSWGGHAPNRTWVDFMAGDFNGDGLDDIAGRDAVNGEWRVARSYGTGFAFQNWGSWSTASAWSNVVCGDFNRDGKADLAGRNALGEWYVSLGSTPFTPLTGVFQTSKWGQWSTATTWSDVQIGDFNGDGRDDIAGRSTIGQWWVNRSTGTSFAAALFYGTWSTATTWSNVRMADFNGDGRDDIIGRSTIGQWWVAECRVSDFAMKHLGNWAGPQSQWSETIVGDFNRDGRADLATRSSLTNQVWTSLWSPTGFITSTWGTLVNGPNRQWQLFDAGRVSPTA